MKFLTLPRLLIAMAVFALLLVGWFLLTEPGRQKDAAAAARVGTISAQGAAAAARDAQGVVITSSKAEVASADLDRRNSDAIKSAQGSNDPVMSGVDRAGRDALCLRDAYRRDPACL